jgi:hypothetical protein
MKKVVWTLGMLALSGGLAAAQDTNELVPTPLPYYDSAAQVQSTLDKALIANEHKINEAVAKGDKAAFSALVAADGASVDGNGFMKVSDFLAAFDQVKVKTWKISDEKVISIDANTAVVTYKWVGSGTFQGQPFPANVFASTVWAKKGDKWVAMFHQESEAAKPAPAKPAAKK